MFTHMVPVKTESHRTRDKDYEILVYQVVETGEYRIFVTDGKFGVGDVFTASQEVVQDSSREGVDIIQTLIDVAKNDIDRNEFDEY